MSELFEGNTGWLVGYIIGIVVVLVVVALVVPILVLASKIGSEAQLIDESLQKSVQNTAALADLGTTNQMAVNVIRRARAGPEATRRMTMVFALTENQETLWQIANWAGLAVVVAVALLLTILVLLVHRIDKRVKNIKATLTQAEANTADAELLNTTAAGVDLVLAEGLEHHLFLGRVLGKVRS